MSIVALVPARNEPDIGKTVDSIFRQSESVDVVLVVINNCTDNGETERIAREHGAEVINLGVVPGKKAGALNRGFDFVAKHHPDATFILQMDGDTILEEHFAQRTRVAMEANPAIGGLCARFVGHAESPPSLLGKYLVLAQRIEYARAADSLLAMQATALAGGATLLRTSALREVLDDRGYVWSEESITEDMELTKALQSRGWICETDVKFVAYTDLMPTMGELRDQRQRWQRGTLDVVFRLYRGKRCVRRDAWMQLYIYSSPFLALLNYAWLTFVILAFGIVNPVSIVSLCMIMVYYGATSWRAGWKGILMAGLMLPMEIYGWPRHLWMWRSLKMYRSTHEQSW